MTDTSPTPTITVPDRLYTLAAALLTTIGDGYTDAGVALPTWQFISPTNPPTPYCEAVAVTLVGVDSSWPGETTGGDPVLSKGSVTSATFHLYVFRCLASAPRGEGAVLLDAPPVADQAADATVIFTDLYVLYRTLMRAKYRGWLGDYATAMSVGPAEPLPGEGGIGGTVIATRLELT